ncbi:serine hydrolase domain-containing protein [Vibrio tapetis subsp. quintayensis]|uniref:serine hydrolase domain-containing protein n=1 Tax=Vibrio tapetis TaxID=52443 RepID=UPI0025B56E2D|nr:serine hydrolase domain-containing protein [Vibrio tapetis]MDN3680873.1 serine hydrolase domain-containing protein [Vibrio tapetis subsp. quintayensis]
MKLSTICTSIAASLVLASSLAIATPSDINPSEGYTQQQSAQFKKDFDINTYQLAVDEDLTRFTYLNMSEFFNHEMIARKGQVTELVTKIDNNIGDVKVNTSHGELTLDQWTKDHLDGVIVVHKGKIVYEKYPRMQAQDKHLWWSISKSVTGTLLGMLEVEGKVNIQDNIEKYIPELNGSDWAGTSVRDIAEMASGMSGLEADDPEAYTNQESPYGLFESSLGLVGQTPKTMKSTYDYMTKLERLKNSGEKHEYTSVNTFVLAWLIEKVTGQTYAEVIEERIWQHIGAENDAMLQVSPSGAPGAHGAISSTLRDLARYGMLFTPSSNKKGVISDKLIKNVQTMGRPEVLKAGIGFDYFNGYFLGDLQSTAYQWDGIMTDGDFAKAGYHGQTLYVSPDKDLVVASFATNQAYYTFSYARQIAKNLAK